MTMPHMMNCPHTGSGWCLDCVKEQGDRLARQAAVIEKLRAAAELVLGDWTNVKTRDALRAALADAGEPGGDGGDRYDPRDVAMLGGGPVRLTRAGRSPTTFNLGQMRWRERFDAAGGSRSAWSRPTSGG